MNIHLNPLDDEQSGALKRHQKMLLGYASDFCQLIEHSENARRDTIKKNVFEEKLQEFARADQLDAEAIAYSRKYPKDGKAQMFADIFDKEKFANSKSVKQAIEAEETDFVMDLSEFAKNAKTTDEITVDRFKCILSKNAVKIK